MYYLCVLCLNGRHAMGRVEESLNYLILLTDYNYNMLGLPYRSRSNIMSPNNNRPGLISKLRNVYATQFNVHSTIYTQR